MASPIQLAKAGIAKIKSAAINFGQTVAGSARSVSSKIANSPRVQTAWRLTKNAGTAIGSAVRKYRAELGKEAVGAFKRFPLTIASAVDKNVKAKHIFISGAVAIALSLTPFTAFVAPVAWGIFGGLCGAKLLARVVLKVHANREREQGREAANNTRNRERSRPPERDRSLERDSEERGLLQPKLLPLTPPEKTQTTVELRDIRDAYISFQTQIRQVYKNADFDKPRLLALFEKKVRVLEIDCVSLSESLQRPGAENLLREAGFSKPNEQRLVLFTVAAIAKADRRLSTTSLEELPSSQHDLRDRRLSASRGRSRTSVSIGGP